MAQMEQPFTLRLEQDLKTELERTAKENERTLAGEIRRRLRLSLLQDEIVANTRKRSKS
jgi:hypothetical protein